MMVLEQFYPTEPSEIMEIRLILSNIVATSHMAIEHLPTVTEN